MMVELAVAHRETYPSRAEQYGPWVNSGIDRARKARPVDLGRGGFQLVGPHGSQATLLKAGHAYQQATDWHTLHPTLD